MGLQQDQYQPVRTSPVYCLDYDLRSQLLTACFIVLPHIYTHTNTLSPLHRTHPCPNLFSLKPHTHTLSPPIPLPMLHHVYCVCVCEVCKGFMWACVLLISEWWKRDVKLAHCLSCSHTHTLVGSHSTVVIPVIERTHKLNTQTLHCPHMSLHLTTNLWMHHIYVNIHK